MSIADEDTDALVKRRVVLDSTLMNLCQAGVEVPPELELEFIAVQDELARRGETSMPEPPRTWTNWLGREIGGYRIEYMIEEGLYWYLFHAVSSHNNADSRESGDENATPAIFKIAKQANLYGVESGRLKYATRLFAIDGDIVREVQPAQNALLDFEMGRLAATSHSALPVIDEEGIIDGCRYYRTPHFSGDTLRELLVHSDPNDAAFGIVSMFSEIAVTLDDLSADPEFAFHGNLKPENIVFTGGGVCFRELGGFCPLQCGDIIEPEVRIAAPQYYPWLDADDITALGICMWEALINYHPFDDSRPAEGDCMISDGLRALVDLELSLSNMFVLPLLSIKRPHQLNVRTSEKLENVLFKSIKMRIGEDGLIHEDPGYESLSEFNEDLLELLNESQMIF